MAGTLYLCATPIGNLEDMDIPGGEDIKRSGSDSQQKIPETVSSF